MRGCAGGGLGVTAALVATDGGSVGAKRAAAPAPAIPTATIPPAFDDDGVEPPGAGLCGGGGGVTVWPF